MRRGWKEAEATVASIYTNSGTDSTTHSVVFTFKVNESYYAGTFTALDSRHYEGEKLKVWFDPPNPDRNHLLQRENLLNWVLWLFLTAFALIFIYSWLHAGRH